MTQSYRVFYETASCIIKISSDFIPDDIVETFCNVVFMWRLNFYTGNGQLPSEGGRACGEIIICRMNANLYFGSGDFAAQ